MLKKLLISARNIFLKKQEVELVSKSADSRNIRCMWCAGYSPTDNNKPYWYLETFSGKLIHSGTEVLVTGKPGRRDRLPKQVTYVGIPVRNPELVALLSSNGTLFHRNQTDVLSLV